MAAVGLPPVKRVISRDRLAAWIVAGILMFAFIGAISNAVFTIFWHRHKPPTETSFIAGSKLVKDGLPEWGRMPYLLVRTQKAEGTITCPPMTDVFFSDTGLGEHAEPTFLNLSLPSCTNINKGAVLVNFTMLVPLFSTKSSGGRGLNVFEFPHEPTIDIRFAVTASDGVDIFYAKAEAPREAVSPPWQESMRWIRYIGGIGDISDTVGQYCHTSLRKRVQPKKGVFWGFDIFDEHTEPKYNFMYLGYHPKKVPMFSRSKRPGVNFAWRITVSSPVIRERKPISIVRQIGHIAAKIGGWMTVITGAFYIFFTRKFPLSEKEKIQSMLVLRFRNEQSSEDFIERGSAIEMAQNPRSLQL